MRILLTGATGFIGTHIGWFMKQEGHDVIGFDQVMDDTSIHDILSPAEIDSLILEQGDVTDLGRILEVCRQYDIETIVHLASLLNKSEEDCQRTVDVNIKGTINMFEAARILGLKRVVWASSQTVFGPADKHAEQWIGNDAPHFPWSMYSACKSFLEYVGCHYHDRFGVDTIGLRYVLVYGVGRQARHGAYPVQLIDNPARGLKGVVDYGDDAPNWLYVKDAARATSLACSVPATKSRVFTIVGEIMPIRDLKDYIQKLLPDAELELKSGKYPSAWQFDASAAEQELGYMPQYSARRGAREIINAIRQKRGLGPVG